MGATDPERTAAADPWMQTSEGLTVHPHRISKDTAAVAGVTGFAAAYTVAVDHGLISRTAASVFSDWAVWIAPLVAGALCLVVARRHRSRIRLGWNLLGASAISWGLGDAVWTYYELVLRTEAKVDYQPSRVGEVTRYVADISKARRILGYSPGVPLTAGIPLYAEWWRSQGWIA